MENGKQNQDDSSNEGRAGLKDDTEPPAKIHKTACDENSRFSDNSTREMYKRVGNKLVRFQDPPVPNCYSPFCQECTERCGYSFIECRECEYNYGMLVVPNCISHLYKEETKRDYQRWKERRPPSPYSLGDTDYERPECDQCGEYCGVAFVPNKNCTDDKCCFVLPICCLDKMNEQA